MIQYYAKKIKKNSIFVDFTKRKEFNPYLLQAAAFGLQVYTTSDIYEVYNYPNVDIISYENKSVLNDLDFYYDRTGCVRAEVLYKKRIMNISELAKKIVEGNGQEIKIDELIQINIKNDWKNILLKYEKNYRLTKISILYYVAGRQGHRPLRTQLLY